MRLHREEAVEAVGGQRADGLADLPVALARRDDVPGGEQRVLDLDVDGVRAQRRVAVGERGDADLHVVGGVPGQPQGGRADRLDDVEHAVRDVAVDVLLVLVQQHDAGGLGLRRRGRVIRRITSSRCCSGAWSGRRKNEKIRMNGAPRRRATARARSARTRWASKSSSMLILPIGEPMDDTDRPCAARSRRDLVDLLVGQVQHVGVPGAAELDVGDAEVVQHRALGLRGRGRSRRRSRTGST